MIKDDFQLRNEDTEHDYAMLNKEEIYEIIDTAYKNGYYWVVERAHTVTRLYAQAYLAPTYYTQLDDLTYVEPELEDGETIRLDNSYKLDKFVKNWNNKNSAPELVVFAGKIRKQSYSSILDEYKNDLIFFSASQNYGSDNNEYRMTLQIEIKRYKL